MTAAQRALGVSGVLVAAYGVWLVVGRGHDLLDVAFWLAAGVVLHDVVLAAWLMFAIGWTDVRPARSSSGICRLNVSSIRYTSSITAMESNPKSSRRW